MVSTTAPSPISCFLCLQILHQNYTSDVPVDIHIDPKGISNRLASPRQPRITRLSFQPHIDLAHCSGCSGCPAFRLLRFYIHCIQTTQGKFLLIFTLTPQKIQAFGHSLTHGFPLDHNFDMVHGSSLSVPRGWFSRLCRVRLLDTFDPDRRRSLTSPREVVTLGICQGGAMGRCSEVRPKLFPPKL